MILYIGNKLVKHGYTPTTVDTLGKLLSVKHDIMTISDKKNKLCRLLHMLSCIVTYRKQISFVLIDTYSSLNFYYAYYCALLSKKLNIPYITILHGGTLPKRLENSPKMSKFLFNNSYINVSPSQYLKHEFFLKGYSNVINIPNNIFITNYPFKERTLVRPRLLWVRSFAKLYNPTMAVLALEKLLKVFPDAELCMVGQEKDGALAETQSLAKELKIQNRVKFTGRLKKEEWISLSEQYDIFINTTTADNMPVSVIEGMALGLPVVSTNVGGIPYLISDGEDGLLIESNNVDQLCSRIIELVKNPNLVTKITRQARKKSINFDWNEVEKKWDDLIAHFE